MRGVVPGLRRGLSHLTVGEAVPRVDPTQGGPNLGLALRGPNFEPPSKLCESEE